MIHSTDVTNILLIILMLIEVWLLPKLIFFIGDKIERRRQRKGWEWIAKHYQDHGYSVPDEVTDGVNHWSKK